MAPSVVDGEGSAPTLVKAEEDAEVPDFGGPADEEKKRPGPLRRSMPDYGDLIDADGIEVKEDVKGEEKLSGEKRPEAIHISGVQRLTRTHIEEIFSSKKLPLFSRVDYLTDDACIVVFSSPSAASAALRGADAGFGDTMVDEERPGPGLWRAQRGMIDFRQATVEDKADMGFKKQHRGGRQVREFRFWEAIKEADKQILQEEDEILPATKRFREEVAAAAEEGEKEEVNTDGESVDEWNKWMSALGGEPQSKRQRTASTEQGDGDGFDLLEAMATQDKAIMAKEAEAPPTEEANNRWNYKPERGEAKDRRQKGKGRGADDEGKGKGRDRAANWNQHDDRGGDRQRGGGNTRSWKEGGEEQSARNEEPNVQKRRRELGEARGKRDALGDAPGLDDEEKAKRSKRSERFNAPIRRTDPEEETTKDRATEALAAKSEQ